MSCLQALCALTAAEENQPCIPKEIMDSARQQLFEIFRQKQYVIDDMRQKCKE